MEIFNNIKISKYITDFLEKYWISLNKFFTPLKSNLKKYFKKINDQLNIYSELKNQYYFQNDIDEQLIYVTLNKNELSNSLVKILIVFKQNEKQQNYFI